MFGEQTINGPSLQDAFKGKKLFRHEISVCKIVITLETFKAEAKKKKKKIQVINSLGCSSEHKKFVKMFDVTSEKRKARW